MAYYEASSREYIMNDTPTTWLKFNSSDTRLVLVFNQSRIGRARYFGLVPQHDNSANKVLNVSIANMPVMKNELKK